MLKYSTAVAFVLWVGANFSFAQNTSLTTFSCQDYADRDWPNKLLGYDIDFPVGKARSGNLRLVDAEGEEQVFQLAAVKTHPDGSIRSCRLHFYAELAAGGNFSYRLETGKPVHSVGNTRVQAKKLGERLQVSSPLLAVELPGETEKRFKDPVDVDKVLAPILKFRVGKG